MLTSLLIKSTMSASPSISPISYGTISGEHFTTRIIDLYIYNLCFFSSKIENYEADIPKAVLIILPIVFSKAGQSFGPRFVGQAPQLQERFPQENWDQLFSSSYKACRLAVSKEHDDISQFPTSING